MRSEWKEYTLGEIVELTIDYRGKTPKKLGLEWSSCGYRALSARNIKTGRLVQPENVYYANEELYSKWMKDEIFQGDILVTSEAPFGEIYYWNTDEKIVLSQRLFAIRCKRTVFPRFIYYYMTTGSFQGDMRGRATGTTVIGLRQPELLKCKVLCPSLSEQKVIAATLSCLDDKIELNNKINANLEAQAQAIFKSWFVDFEPFRDGEFVDSELGPIPKGWSIQSIEDIADKVAMGPFGSNIKVETFVDNGVPVISGNHLRGLYLEENEYKYITEEHANRLKNSLVYAGDIIFTHAGNIGQVAIIPNGCEHSYYIISQRQFYLRCNTEKVVPEYINYYFHSYEGQGKLLANKTQTGVPSIARPSSHLKSITIPLPPLKSQQEWHVIIDPLLKKMIKIKKYNKTLSALRDTLLPKLMSGEIEVPVVESIIQERS